MQTHSRRSQPETGNVSFIVLIIVAIILISTTTITAATLQVIGTPASTSSTSCLPSRVSHLSSISAASINSELISIGGSCFGSNPSAKSLSDGSVATQPDSVTPSLVIVDQTKGWSAGFGGDLIGVHIASWNDSEIQLSGLGSQVGPTSGAQLDSISSGDSIVIYVSGPNCNAPGWPTIGVPPTTPWPLGCTGSGMVTAGP